MAAALRSCTAALNRVTQFLNSSSGVGAGACRQQLAQLQAQLRKASTMPPMPRALPSFGQEAQAVLRALYAALAALAAERHARNMDWMQLLTSVLHAWSSVCTACAASRDCVAAAQMHAWLLQQPQSEWPRPRRQRLPCLQRAPPRAVAAGRPGVSHKAAWLTHNARGAASSCCLAQVPRSCRPPSSCCKASPQQLSRGRQHALPCP